MSERLFTKWSHIAGDVWINPRHVIAIMRSPDNPDVTRIFVGGGEDDYFGVNDTPENVAKTLEGYYE